MTSTPKPPIPPWLPDEERKLVTAAFDHRQSEIARILATKRQRPSIGGIAQLLANGIVRHVDGHPDLLALRAKLPKRDHPAYGQRRVEWQDRRREIIAEIEGVTLEWVNATVGKATPARPARRSRKVS